VRKKTSSSNGNAVIKEKDYNFDNGTDIKEEDAMEE
jgi:hypothetical protein